MAWRDNDDMMSQETAGVQRSNGDQKMAGCLAPPHWNRSTNFKHNHLERRPKRESTWWHMPAIRHRKSASLMTYNPELESFKGGLSIKWKQKAWVHAACFRPPLLDTSQNDTLSHHRQRKIGNAKQNGWFNLPLLAIASLT